MDVSLTVPRAVRVAARESGAQPKRLFVEELNHIIPFVVPLEMLRTPSCSGNAARSAQRSTDLGKFSKVLMIEDVVFMRNDTADNYKTWETRKCKKVDFSGCVVLRARWVAIGMSRVVLRARAHKNIDVFEAAFYLVMANSKYCSRGNAVRVA